MTPEEVVAARKGKSGVDEKVQSTEKSEEKRDRSCEYICQFFYEAGIPHNTVTLPNFDLMLEAIGDFGRNLRGPTPYEMSGKFLQKRKRKVKEVLKSHQQSWELNGCTVMTDAWTDKRGRGVMNLVVHSAYGFCFLDSVDCSDVKNDGKDGRYIFDLVDRCIEEIGIQNVVQVVTDNARPNEAASSLLKAKHPSIFWDGCAAHTIDLMLEDIEKMPRVASTISKAKCLTVFLYAHTRVLDLMRKFLSRDLVRCGVTRFATAYLNLKSLLENKKEVKRLFKDDELNELGYLKSAKGKKANNVVKSETF
ncbi:hAT transposon superfamily protein [Striga hermonthica]|uniref:HAT transposon superfamily protein n=1 Tax=Striga hermonthica TaxID=68872 RepID=A0A9N7RDZ9_STRHE|nr:hAT transposon superfamily protein [Striga hermonthica]